LLINKDAFCDGSLQKEVMKISSMTGVVHWMLEEIVGSMNDVNLLIDEELNEAALVQLKDIKNGKHSHIGNNYWNRFDFRWSS